jgi:DNA-binding beta-propeller fold protein YncE
MTDSKECKIIDSIKNIKYPESLIQTPCGKFLIGIERHSIFRYNLETKSKFRIAGPVNTRDHQDGTRDEARFNYPTDLTLSKDSKTLFITDTWNHVIRTICVDTGITKTFVGQVGLNKHVDGPNGVACFKKPRSLKLSPDGNTLYVVDLRRLRSICIATGQVNTIHTFKQKVLDFSLSSDGKHVIICHFKKVSKYNLETGESEIILEVHIQQSLDISKDGQLLFISSYKNKCILVVNLVTKKIIDNFESETDSITISTNGKKLYISDISNHKIQVLDISKYCTNFKTFLQSQIFKQSFLPRQVIRFN